MAENTQPKPSVPSSSPLIGDQPFEPPFTGNTTPGNPPPLIEKPPMPGGEDGDL